MCQIVGVNFLLLLSLGVVFAVPIFDELMHEQGDDTAVVESVVREARAIGPEHIGELLGPGVKDAFLHTYGDKNRDEGDLQGYSKNMKDNGNDGYKHFDSFHKKDADKFGFEVHSEFGQAEKASIDTEDDKGKSEEASEDDGEESKKSYLVTEELDENKKNKNAIDGADFGYYADSGDAGYSNAEAESDSGSEGGSEHYEGGESGSFSEGDGESESYTSEDGDSGSHAAAAEDDYGESAGYAEAEGDDY